ncbi:MAG: DUF5605 domain-containing protein, partial [Microbacterium arborescens]
PRFRNVILEAGAWRVEVIDTWNMTVDEVPGQHRDRVRVDLPGRPFVALRLTRVAD